MDFLDKFKRFLGFSVPPKSPNPDTYDRNWPQQPPIRNDDDFEPHVRSFTIMTDPFEIHKYFEQQMGEMLRNFGFNEFGDGFGHHFGNIFNNQIDDGVGHFVDGFSNQFGLPQIEEISDGGEPSGDLRDAFLKPGFDKGQQVPVQRRDTEIDGKLDIKNWGSVLRGEISPQQVVPKTQFFGQSVTSKTIRNADGTIEIHHTVRDSSGNEETTITRKVGDKEYSITKRKDKDGKEETIENLVNLDEKEVDKFFPKQPPLQQLDEKPWPFFDKFFK